MTVHHVAEITAASSTSHPAKPVIPHLSSCLPVQCIVAGSLVWSSQRGVKLQHASTEKGKGWLWWSYVVYSWSVKGERKQGRRVGVVSRGYMEGMWRENKQGGLQTVEPTMVCQIQVCLRSMCPLCKHKELSPFLDHPFHLMTHPRTQYLYNMFLTELKLSWSQRMQGLMLTQTQGHTTVTTQP